MGLPVGFRLKGHRGTSRSHSPGGTQSCNRTRWQFFVHPLLELAVPGPNGAPAPTGPAAADEEFDE